MSIYWGRAAAVSPWTSSHQIYAFPLSSTGRWEPWKLAQLLLCGSEGGSLELWPGTCPLPHNPNQPSLTQLETFLVEALIQCIDIAQGNISIGNRFCGKRNRIWLYGAVKVCVCILEYTVHICCLHFGLSRRALHQNLCVALKAPPNVPGPQRTVPLPSLLTQLPCIYPVIAVINWSKNE